MFKMGPSVLALSRARTANAIIGNIPRLVTLPIAWWVAVEWGDLRLILLLLIAGEFLGAILATLVLWYQMPLRWAELTYTYVFMTPFLLLAGVMSLGLAEFGETKTAISLLLTLLLALAPMRSLQKYGLKYLRQAFPR